MSYDVDVIGGMQPATVSDLDLVGAGPFTCDVPLDELEAFQMPLFPGQRNHWLVMTPVKPGVGDAAKQTKQVDFAVRTLLAHFKGSKVPGGGMLEYSYPVHPTRLKQLRIGPQFVVGPPPFLMNARRGDPRVIAQLAPPGVTGGGPSGQKLYRQTLFTPVSFVYTPDRAHNSSPWVWHRAPKLFRDCADGGYGVAAVFQPTPLTQAELKAAEEEPSTPFGDLGKELSKTTKAIMWGGAAILLFQLYNATRTDR